VVAVSGRRVTRAILSAALAVALVLVLGLASGCGPSKAQLAAQHRDECFANQREIKQAIDLEHADSGVYPSISDVLRVVHVSCPDGGTYSFDPNTDTVSCSIHGAAPADSGGQ
jgi:hypothetical protein